MKAKLQGAAAGVAIFMLGVPASATIVDLNYDGMIVRDRDSTALGTFVGNSNVFGDDNHNIFILNAPVGVFDDDHGYFADSISQISNYSYAVYNEWMPYVSAFVFGYTPNNNVPIFNDYTSSGSFTPTVRRPIDSGHGFRERDDVDEK